MSDVSNENDLQSVNDQEISMSEQDMRNVLLEAGYTFNEINDALAAQVRNGINPPSSNIDSTDSDASDSETVKGSALDILKEIRVKNVNKVVIGTLNINSLAPKLDQLSEVIGQNLDILTIQETKLDPSFPSEQLMLTGYSASYRLDRNRAGGGVMIYVREDIPSKLLTKHNFTKGVEGLFLEINLKKTKLLFFGGYRSDHESDFLDQISFALDNYSSYEKFLLAGDFNIDGEEEILQEFLFEQNVKNLVKHKTCFKSSENPSCIDLFLTNSSLSFQNTATVTTGLFDFRKMAVTAMKTAFPKAESQVVYYRDYKNFDLFNFRTELREELRINREKD